MSTSDVSSVCNKSLTRCQLMTTLPNTMKPTPFRFLLSISIWIATLPCSKSFADDARSLHAASEFLQNHCAACHEGDAAEAGFDVGALTTDLSNAQTLEKWIYVYDRVHAGEMPPPESSDVSTDEREAFLASSREWLTEHQHRQWNEQGRVRGRRLTNLQLERTLHDLLGIDIPIASQMPEEQRTAGFTNVADGQPMSHFQLEQHLKIVDAALDEAFERAAGDRKLFSQEFDARGLARTNPKRRTREPEMIDGLAVTWSSRLIFYGRLPATTARHDGWYRFTVRAKALNLPKDHGVWCTVRTGKCVSSAPLLNWVGAFEATENVQEWTFEAWMPRGEMLEIRPGDDTLKMARFAGGQVGTGEGGPQKVPGVAIESLVMQEVHHGPDDAAIRRTLFDDLPVKLEKKSSSLIIDSQQPRKDLQRLMQRFATHAFRRPVEPEVVEPFVELAWDTFDSGQSFAEALRTGYRSLLCSPRFLYFSESPGQLDAYALASRLSYFLWNSMPDAELLALAESGRLTDDDVLRGQVERMLEHPRGKDFVKDFAAQWLDLSLIDFTTPDRRLFPNFDVIVQHSMLAETETFLQDMLEDNLSVELLIDSDYTYLNERLARFYRIDGVQGDELRRVSLSPKDHRGGVLTQGAIMKVTANGTTTSPVIRGVWISERLLGVDIPAPPSGVPAIEPDIRGAKTIREMLAKHKSDPSCASCHVKIDPPGFALENFDPAGQWRDTYPKFQGRKRVNGTPIDASFTLPDGEPFQNLKEFQSLIRRKTDQLAANVANKLLTYATGTPVTFADREDVDEIVNHAASHEYGLRTIVTEVVLSPVFRNK